MILFHGTSTYYKARIAKDYQLKPRRRKKGNYDADLKSDPECVYLTDVYAHAFARIAVNAKGGRPLILKVEVDESTIEPDTDYISSGSHHSTFEDGIECLEKTGCCAVRGVVEIIDGFIPDKETWERYCQQPMRINTGFMHAALKKQNEETLNVILWNSSKIF